MQAGQTAMMEKTLDRVKCFDGQWAAWRGLRRCHFTPRSPDQHINSLPAASSSIQTQKAARMDLSCSTLSFSTQSWSSPSSDSEIYNISSPEAVSPLNCLDFSPVSNPQDGPAPARSAIPKQCEESNIPGCMPRTRTRSKNPSKQRQNASEKEKLRMRDLTKALHHLRSFLPPSVAPAGQTLTKIETLRLTIRYISYLSSQLGLGEEPLCQGGDLGPPRSGMCHYSSIPGAWRSMPGAEAHTEAFRPLSHHGMTAAGPQDAMDMAFFSSRDVLDSMLECQTYPDTSFSYQDCSKAVHYESVGPAFWS
ncbi:hypothetical protein AOLI_G00055830 [Acnodon oligacanthus]